MSTEIMWLKDGKGQMVRVEATIESGRMCLNFPFSRGLLDEVKSTFDGRKYHGFDKENPRKIWSFPVDNEHNQFQLKYLKGEDPYKRFTDPVQLIKPRRQGVLREHQVYGYSLAVQRRHCILGWQMGTGKTLVAIETIEQVGSRNVWYVSPKTALVSSQIEFDRWNCAILPTFMTYEGMVRRMEEWKPGTPPPDAVIFDEASRLKTPTSKRSIAAYHLSKAIRKEFGYNSLILLMSGTPAPKSPADWWMLCHIACPGFLKEGNSFGFNDRYALLLTEDHGAGPYKKIVTWRDNENKCNVCGSPRVSHELALDGVESVDHEFKPMVNEVAKLYGRMKGLVDIKLKKDCLNLPDKIYRKVQVEMPASTLRAAAMLARSAQRSIEALTRLRELSDGFQYYKEEGPDEPCERCEGRRTEISEGTEAPCRICHGVGVRRTVIDRVKRLPAAKDEALENLLEEVEDIGRVVVYAGFTESVDRVCDVLTKNDWKVIRLDGRGCHSPYGDLRASIAAFQDPNNPDKIGFVSNAGSGGMGITLTASPMTIFYSNTFRNEDRSQAEDRIHRMGMDENRGATIVDLIGLKADEFVLQNLQKKKELEQISMGELLEAALDTMPVEFR